jgi:hypothetical protein
LRMTALMETKKRAVLLLRASTHRDLKVEAARASIDMSELADIAISHVTGLLSSGRIPAAVADAIERARGDDGKPPAGKGKP